MRGSLQIPVDDLIRLKRLHRAVGPRGNGIQWENHEPTGQGYTWTILPRPKGIEYLEMESHRFDGKIRFE
jgi:hypothetical protein